MTSSGSSMSVFGHAALSRSVHTVPADAFVDRPRWASTLALPSFLADRRREDPDSSAVTVPVFVSPALVSADVGVLGHNICAFAQREGCSHETVGDLRADAPWGLDNFNPSCNPLDVLPFGTVITAEVEQAARAYLASIRELWSPVMDSLRDIYSDLQPELACSAFVARLPAYRVVRLAQSQYQQVAFSAQLARAAVHEAILLSAGEQWAESFRSLIPSLRAWIAVSPPFVMLRNDDAQLGTVPAAQLTAAYVRYMWYNRGPVPWPTASGIAVGVHQQQLVAFIELDVPAVVPVLRHRTLQAYLAVAQAVGDSAACLGVPRSLLPSPDQVVTGYPLWSKFVGCFSAQVGPVIALLPSSALGTALQELRAAIAAQLATEPLMPPAADPTFHSDPTLPGLVPLLCAVQSHAGADALRRGLTLQAECRIVGERATVDPGLRMRQFLTFMASPLPLLPGLTPVLLDRYQGFALVVAIHAEAILPGTPAPLPVAPATAVHPSLMPLARWVLAFAAVARDICAIDPSSPLAVAIRLLAEDALACALILPLRDAALLADPVAAEALSDRCPALFRACSAWGTEERLVWCDGFWDIGAPGMADAQYAGGPVDAGPVGYPPSISRKRQAQVLHPASAHRSPDLVTLLSSTPSPSAGRADTGHVAPTTTRWFRYFPCLHPFGWAAGIRRRFRPRPHGRSINGGVAPGRPPRRTRARRPTLATSTPWNALCGMAGSCRSSWQPDRSFPSTSRLLFAVL
jgi:hypothetical protein